ncbi:MAG: hypothetical protein HeimC3_03610 [Candidatus Heimdallarchaeota archaeon LC_3]|nr:MAG: hypothetical protein HeimC3_03610 [Candidatus Heimdallarchaeota archaeon LC_3]
MNISNLKFCVECGTVLERNKICKKCTPFISKNVKRENLTKGHNERRIPQKFFTKKAHGPPAEEQNNKKKEEYQIVRNKRLRTVAIYSEDRGLEIGWDLDTPEKKLTRAVFCIKCRNLRANWEGIWIIPGGKGRSLDPLIKPKRIFLCGRCWSPHKSKKSVSVEEIGLPEDQLFSPL